MARWIVRAALQDVVRQRDDRVQIERARRCAGRCQDPLMVGFDGAAELPRQHSRRGGRQPHRAIRRLHQGKDLVLFPAVEVGIGPGDRPGTGGGTAQRRHIRRPGR